MGLVTSSSTCVKPVFRLWKEMLPTGGFSLQAGVVGGFEAVFAAMDDLRGAGTSDCNYIMAEFGEFIHDGRRKGLGP